MVLVFESFRSHFRSFWWYLFVCWYFWVVSEKKDQFWVITSRIKVKPEWASAKSKRSGFSFSDRRPHLYVTPDLKISSLERKHFGQNHDFRSRDCGNMWSKVIWFEKYMPATSKWDRFQVNFEDWKYSKWSAFWLVDSNRQYFSVMTCTLLKPDTRSPKGALH